MFETLLVAIVLLLAGIFLAVIGRNGRKILFLVIAAAFIAGMMLTGKAPAHPDHNNCHRHADGIYHCQ
jgi:hypothetical protein